MIQTFLLAAWWRMKDGGWRMKDEGWRMKTTFWLPLDQNVSLLYNMKSGVMIPLEVCLLYRIDLATLFFGIFFHFSVWSCVLFFQVLSRIVLEFLLEFHWFYRLVFIVFPSSFFIFTYLFQFLSSNIWSSCHPSLKDIVILISFSAS